MVTSEAVVFDVRGTHHVLSKALLEEYPDTVLAQKAFAETEALSSPISLDLDPHRFPYIQAYMSGKVKLPVFVSKAEILEDLASLGFTEIDESLLDDELSRQHSARTMNHVIQSVNEDIFDMQQLVVDMEARTQQQVAAVQRKIGIANLAMHSYRESSKFMSQYGTVKFDPEEFGIQLERDRSGLSRFFHDADMSYLKSFWEKLGLEYVSCNAFLGESVSLKLKKLLH